MVDLRSMDCTRQDKDCDHLQRVVLISEGIHRIHPTLKEFINIKTNAQARQQIEEAVQTEVAILAISTSRVGSGIAKDGLPIK